MERRDFESDLRVVATGVCQFTLRTGWPGYLTHSAASKLRRLQSVTYVALRSDISRTLLASGNGLKSFVYV